MVSSRYRFKVTNLDHVDRGHGAWNSPISLGYFQDRVTTIIGGVPQYSWGLPNNPQSFTPDNSICAVEQTWDELHPRSRGDTYELREKRTPRYLTGGPFLNVKIDTGSPVSGAVSGGTYYNVSGSRRYVGGFMPPPNSSWGAGWASSPLAYTGQSNDLLPLVAPYFDRAWSSAKPKLELGSLYVFLKEFEDAIPMLQNTAELFGRRWAGEYRYLTGNVGSRGINISRAAQTDKKVMYPKFLANQFLNQQFGWNPFLNDLKGFFNTYLDASREIERITRENGKWVRKKVRVTKDESDVVVEDVQLPYNSVSYAVPCFPVGFPSDFFTSPPSWQITEKTQFSVNASGKFRFYRPEFDITLPDYGSAWNQVMRYVKIYGLEVSPYHIWQATPWTWLIDWVSNLGSFVQRISDTLEDQVAAAYFFITAHKRVERTITIRLPFTSGLKTLSFTRSYTSKQRVSADSPYGFRLTWENLTPKQLTILASLGITRFKGRGV